MSRCEAWSIWTRKQCPREADAVYQEICVHEHVTEARLCSRCAENSRALCGPCHAHPAQPHDCTATLVRLEAVA